MHHSKSMKQMVKCAPFKIHEANGKMCTIHLDRLPSYGSTILSTTTNQNKFSIFLMLSSYPMKESISISKKNI